MKINTSYYFKLVLLLFVASCTTSQARKNAALKLQNQKKEISYLPEFPAPNKRDLKVKHAQVLDFYKKAMDPKHFNGQFLVAKNGKVLFIRSNGFSNIRDKKKMTLNTPMHVASVSKVATALAVLRLVSKKQIFLDSDVRWYLPDLPYKGITVRMLLNHRSGIPYYGYFTFKTWHLGKTLYNRNVLKLLKKHKFPLNFPPDTKFAYSNTNYALLALIIEKVTNQSFPQAMKTLVFEPLKMKKTFILDRSTNLSKICQSYNSNKKLENFDYLDAVYGDKNMYTTALDLLQMDKGTYSENFLPDSLRKQMFKGYSYEHPGKSNYGLGMRLKEMKGKDTYYFHSGWWHGNTACFTTLRNDTICIIALSNVYSQKVWGVNRLAMNFGNYPFQFQFE
jgi:CubicO group peptidase (beta-lactamase class C family)